MSPGLKVGVTAQVEVTVTEDMCPAFDGVIVHRVYSTWSLAHHMELAARKVLAPFLEAHEEGLGTHLSVDHLAPTPVGKTVRVVAEATGVDDRRLVCTVRAFDGARLIAHGTQVQRLLPRETIRSLIERHR
ncbi:MAG: thioesterase [Phycisphaerales bacterium]|nr:MAG: thioesterase [Phycisphaerales bacterium]